MVLWDAPLQRHAERAVPTAPRITVKTPTNLEPPKGANSNLQINHQPGFLEALTRHDLVWDLNSRTTFDRRLIRLIHCTITL